jgi:D-sedoheptulose 7-phosphate isomerase
VSTRICDDPDEKLSELDLAHSRVRESAACLERLLEAERLRPVVDAARVIVDVLRRGGKIVVFGNGGSAADAQHFAAELLGRFELERAPLPAISLTDNTSAITAVGNDYGFENVFSRQLRGLGQRGDIALGISTSGNSSNVIEAVRVAAGLGMTTIGLTGGDGGRLRDEVDHCLIVPADGTPRIQEVHAVVIHLICEIVERQLAEAPVAS